MDERVHRLFRATRQGAERRARQFGRAPLRREDVEALISIAASASPSGTWKETLMRVALQRPDLYRDEMLTSLVARAVRWLAVIRRDEGEEAFRRAAQVWKVEVGE